MKQIIPFSKYFILTAILSFILMGLSIGGFFSLGFNLGVDFQAGLLQEVQFAPTAFRITYNGPGNASISLSRSSLDILVSGVGVDELNHIFPFTVYSNHGELARGLRGVEGLNVSEIGPSNASSLWLVQSAQSNPLLEANNPFIIHYLPPDTSPIRIEDVRTTLLPLGTVSVQNLGNPEDRRFMIRMEDSELGGFVSAERIITTLENSFGAGEVVVTRSDYVGSRFSRELTNQTTFLLAMTLLLILAYCSVRFRFQFALGAVLAIVHNSIITVGFITWSRMEFSTLTIAAILTILGYSINDVVVVFDRMRETRRNYPDDNFVTVLNRALTETLSRTIITTVTTMLAVASLYIFTTGAMKDFALCLLIGMVTGVYSTIFIASGFIYFWESTKASKSKKSIKTDNPPLNAA